MASILLWVIRELYQRRFKRRTSTRNEAFSLSICLDPAKFILLCAFSLTETIARKVRQNHCLRVQKVHSLSSRENVFA